MYYLALCKFPIYAHAYVCLLRGYHALALSMYICTIAYLVHAATYSTALHLIIAKYIFDYKFCNIFLILVVIYSNMFIHVS